MSGGWDVIFQYTRAQAIEDGVLVDASEMAREAGIRYPVALTQAVWAECVAVPDGVTGQDEAGRLWDILWMFRCAAARGQGGDELRFGLYVKNREGRAAELVELKAHCGPGDEAEPVITIMMPGED
jgi:hypothetical protein